MGLLAINFKRSRFDKQYGLLGGSDNDLGYMPVRGVWAQYFIVSFLTIDR